MIFRQTNNIMGCCSDVITVPVMKERITANQLKIIWTRKLLVMILVSDKNLILSFSCTGIDESRNLIYLIPIGDFAIQIWIYSIQTKHNKKLGLLISRIFRKKYIGSLARGNLRLYFSRIMVIFNISWYPQNHKIQA